MVIEALLSKPSPQYKTLRYIGSSMNPLFRDLDILHIRPLPPSKIRAGDIIVFKPPQSNETIVHRVLQITPGGFITKGDNCSHPDKYLVQPSDIIGITVSYNRINRTIKVRRGFAGSLINSFIRRQLSTVNHAKIIAVFFLITFCKIKLIRKTLNRLVKYRIISASVQNNNCICLYLGKRKVGVYDSAENCWKISPPYDRIIDFEKLPISPALEKPLQN